MQLVATVNGRRERSSRRIIRTFSLLIMFAGLSLFAGNTDATPLTLTWSTTSPSYPDWSTSSIWRSGATSRVPLASDTLLVGSGAYLHTSTKIVSPGLKICKDLYLAHATSSISTIQQDKVTTGGTTELRVMNNAYIGYRGKGTFALKSSQYSKFDVLGDEQVGYFSGSIGNLSITGQHSVTGSLYMGQYSGSTGDVSLNTGGVVSAKGETVGATGEGTFTQNSGTNTVGSFGLTLGATSGGEGTYELSGGLLRVDPTAKTGDVFIGRSGKGTFNHTGGTAYFYDNLYMGAKAGAQSLYNLSQGGRLYGTTEYIGFEENASFRQYDASSFHQATDNVYLGYSTGVNGLYQQFDGRAYFSADEIVGYRGTGNVLQYNGTHAVTNNLILGQQSGSTGNYLAYNGTSSSGTLIVGESGTGTFDQRGGTNTVNTMYVGKESTSNSTYKLNGATAQVTIGKAYVGNAGKGVFQHTDGIADFSSLLVGVESNGYGSYALSGVDSTLDSDLAYIGYHTVGKFSHTSGTHTNAKSLRLGYYDDGNGSYTLSGSANLHSKNEVMVGYYGTGTFNQKGATHTIDRHLIIGGAAGSNGTYSLNGGTLTGTGDMIVRSNGNAEGTFKGTGTVGLTGPLTNNGKVIADAPATLDLSGMSDVKNTIENDAAYGWYTENGAKLLLPSLAITAGSNSYNWGESTDDDLIDLVNSVTMDFDNVLSDNTLSISLLDQLHSDVPAGLVDPLGVWAFDPGVQFTFDSVALGFRYDDALLASMAGLNSVELYHYDGGVWNNITGNVDLVNHIVYGYDIDSFSNFAVVGAYAPPPGGTAIPEPATILLFSAALITLGGRTLKRRRIR